MLFFPPFSEIDAFYMVFFLIGVFYFFQGVFFGVFSQISQKHLPEYHWVGLNVLTFLKGVSGVWTVLPV